MSRRQFALPERTADSPPDDTGCTVLHVDMDAFYASATLLSHPDLVGTPVIIGGGNRGVVLSATYEARRFGVASAMPMARARRLCPQATVLPPDHRLYSRISDAVMATFASITPVVEPLSLDEAFLDVAGAVRRLGSPGSHRPAAPRHRRRRAGHHLLGRRGTLPSSSPSSPPAWPSPTAWSSCPRRRSSASSSSCPSGPCGGSATAPRRPCCRLGLRTVADIAHTPLATLKRAMGEAAGAHLHDLAWGRDPRGVEPVRRERSIGSDETFSHDVDDPAYIHRQLLKLSDRTAARVRAAGLMGRTVSIKVRFSDFTTITRSKTLRDPTDISRDIYDTARVLYDGLGLQRARIRLVGVRVEQLVDSDGAPIQGTLDEPDHGWREADRAVDRASARFGAGSVRPASLIGDRGTGFPTPRGDIS